MINIYASVDGRDLGAVANDIGGAFMILALGVAMATMTSIVAHAMDTDN